MTIVIGHGGASTVAAANTLRSFDAALAAGADMVEFDVRRRRGRLVLVHNVLPVRDPLSLDDALAHFAQPRFAGVGLNVDVKAPGYELQTLHALREHGVSDRTLISSQFPVVIDRFRAADEDIATAISIGGPFARRVRSRSLRCWRRAIVDALAAGRYGDVMLHHRLVDAELCAAVAALGRRAFAWTVDEPTRFAALAAAGVAGVVTGDPGRIAAGRARRP